jgi:hypothetical protein
MDHADAVTCTTNYGGCFRVDGSDTLTQVVQDAIFFSKACISYHNIGSGQGEHNIINDSKALTIQGIAPMSRNFTVAAAAAANALGITVGFKNIVALDAPVVTFNVLANNVCGNLAPGYMGDGGLGGTGPIDQSMAPPNNDLAVLLGGYPKSGAVAYNASLGTTQECADPRRIAVVDKMAKCQDDVDQITHILRRDDKSGTQDTFREHLGFAYWCNGNSPGNTNKNGSNLFNEDLDPIRHVCVGADPDPTKGKHQTRCTYYPTTQTCTAGSSSITDPVYGTLTCTQGLVVAISENDGGQPDITMSIGSRVGGDLTHRTVGLAGLASSNPETVKTQGATINTNGYDADTIMAKAYMFARRLYLMGEGTTTNSVRNAQEKVLFDYMTKNCQIGVTNPPGRSNPILKDAGFLIPQPGQCGNDPCTALTTDPLACGPRDDGASMAAQNIGWQETCTSNGNPCVTGQTCGTDSKCPDISPRLATDYGCHVNKVCASNLCTKSAPSGKADTLTCQ